MEKLITIIDFSLLFFVLLWYYNNKRWSNMSLLEYKNYFLGALKQLEKQMNKEDFEELFERIRSFPPGTTFYNPSGRR